MSRIGRLWLFRTAVAVAACQLISPLPGPLRRPPPAALGVLFESTWDTAVGASTTNAVTDGGRWPNYWEFNNDTTV